MAGKAVYRKLAAKFGAEAAKEYLYGNAGASGLSKDKDGNIVKAESKKPLVVTINDVRGNPKAIKATDYIKGVKTAKSLSPETRVKAMGVETTAGDIVADYRRMVNRRINDKIPGFDVGRNKGADVQGENYRLAAKVNSRARVRTPDVPVRFREKLKNRIDDSRDF